MNIDNENPLGYFLFCCPAEISPLIFDPDRPPFESYGPVLAACHGWYFGIDSTDIPIPPFFKGDKSRLIECQNIGNVNKFGCEKIRNGSWLDGNFLEWREITKEIKNIDPFDRGFSCKLLVSDRAKYLLKKYKKVKYNKVQNISRDDYLIDQISDMVMSCYDEIGIESTWSNAYTAFRYEDINRLKELYWKCNDPLDIYYLLEGIVKIYYNTFVINQEVSQMEYWGNEYLEKLPKFNALIPVTEDGKRVSSGLQYYSMFCERINDYDRAIQISKIGISFNLWDKTKGGFARRIESLLKKRNELA